MRTEALVNRLSQGLRPVRRRSVAREALLLLLLGVLEVAAFLGMGFMRPDMPVAVEAPSFWWKLISMGLIAVLGAGVAILSGDPVRSPRRGLRLILRLHPRDPRRRLADRRFGKRTCGPGSASRLVAGPTVRLEDGGAVDPTSHRLWRTPTTGRTDRPRRNRLGGRAVLRRLGRLRLRIFLPLRRSALHRRLVHARMLDCHDIGTGDSDSIVPVVTSQSSAMRP